MKSFLPIIAMAAVAAVVFPSVAFLFGWLSLPAVKWIALAATVVWFLTAPIWFAGPPNPLDTSDPPSI